MSYVESTSYMEKLGDVLDRVRALGDVLESLAGPEPEGYTFAAQAAGLVRILDDGPLLRELARVGLIEYGTTHGGESA